MESSSHWPCLERFVEIRSPWLTLIGEKLQDDQQQVLDYWRVEKADSAIALTIHRDCLLLPPPMYRPGLGTATWDFPGGRVLADESPEEATRRALQRELGIAAADIATLSVLNPQGWAINSSFSNQKLYGLVATLSPDIAIDPALVGASYPTTAAGVEALLTVLTCLQCRAVLLEWWRC